MKKLMISILAMVVFSTLANASPVSARYLRIDGYYSSNNGAVGLYEIEAYANGVNIARNAPVTVNSGFYPERLTDGNTTGNYFTTNQNDPGPASELVPHWIQLDLGSIQPIDRVQVYIWANNSVSYGVYFSADGASWTQVARNVNVSGTIQNDPSAPFVIIQSAVMRPGTTLMDVVYRVNDPDDATVKVRALAFVDGVRSFANVLRPVAFAEGTEVNIGDAIAANADHTLTWNVATDWNVDLGQVKFEVLAMDGRGLLEFDWITVPATGDDPELTISKNYTVGQQVCDALFWQYADGDIGVTLEAGILKTPNAKLVSGDQVTHAASLYVLKVMDLDVDDGVKAVAARAREDSYDGYFAVNRPYAHRSILASSGGLWTAIEHPSLRGVSRIISSSNSPSYALTNEKRVISLGYNQGSSGEIGPVDGLVDVVDIASSGSGTLTLSSDGSVLGAGYSSYGQFTPPVGLSNVVAIATGYRHSLALKSDGTVVAWGSNYSYHDDRLIEQAIPPEGLTGVVKIYAGDFYSVALKASGAIVVWGEDNPDRPRGIGYVDLAIGQNHSLGLRSDGTVRKFGYTSEPIPEGLTDVIAIAVSYHYNFAVKSDGTVVSWGDESGEVDTSGLVNVKEVFSSDYETYMIVGD